MFKPLFLVESSAKAASLTDLLSQKIDTLIIENSPLKVILPVRTEKRKGSQPFLFRAIPAAQRIVDKISHPARDLYLAFDSDEQGDHWSWMIREFIAGNVEEFNEPKRLRIDGMTQEDILSSLEGPFDNNYQKGFTYEISSRFDSLLGRHFERLTGSQKSPEGLDLNFSVLTLLFFLTEREDEIRRFSPANKGQIVTTLSNGEGTFEARLKTASGITSDGLLRSKDEFEKVKSLLRGKDFSVKSVSRALKKIHPPLPFNTVNLVQEAYLQLKMDPEKTLHTARKLFHGMEIDGKNRGLISFFITEETDFPEDVSDMLQEYLLSAEKGDSSLSCQITNENSDLPIIPLMPDITPEDIVADLGQEAADLYELIRNRTFAGQMDEASVENIDMVIQAGDDCTLTTSAQSVIEKGHFDLHQSVTERQMLVDSPIAHISEGHVLKRVKTFIEATSGVPPEYYTLESVFSDLAEMGIRLNSETASIVKDMLRIGYLKIAPEGTLHPGKSCMKLVKLVNSVFPTMSGLNLSAYFMQTVEEVTSGRKSLWQALSQLDQILHMHGKRAVKATDSILDHKRTESHQKSLYRAENGQEQQSKVHVRKERGAESAEVSSPKESIKIKQSKAHGSQSLEDDRTGKAATPDHIVVDAGDSKPDGIQPKTREETTDPLQEAVTDPRPAATSEEVEYENEQPSVKNKISFKTDGSDQERLQDTEIETGMVKGEPDEAGGETEVIALNKKAAETAEDTLPPATFQESVEPAAHDGVLKDKTSVTEREESDDGLFPEQRREVEEVSASKEPAQEPEKDQQKEKYCPDCGRNMKQKEDAYGKYWQCSGFPQCRHAESYDRLPLKMVCPICTRGEVITKRTPIGKRFYVCAEKECEFITWHLPHDTSCPECNNPFLIEKKTPKGETILKCPKAGCRYRKSLSGMSTHESASHMAQPQGAPKVRKVRVKAKSGSGNPSKKVVRRVVRVKAR